MVGGSWGHCISNFHTLTVEVIKSNRISHGEHGSMLQPSDPNIASQGLSSVCRYNYSHGVVNRIPLWYGIYKG